MYLYFLTRRRKLQLNSTHYPENMHLSTPFPPYIAMPFSLNTEMGSISGTDVAAERCTRKLKIIHVYIFLYIMWLTPRYNLVYFITPKSQINWCYQYFNVFGCTLGQNYFLSYYLRADSAIHFPCMYLRSILRVVSLPTTNVFRCSCHTPHLYCKPFQSLVSVHRKWRSPANQNQVKSNYCVIHYLSFILIASLVQTLSVFNWWRLSILRKKFIIVNMVILFTHVILVKMFEIHNNSSTTIRSYGVYKK